MPRLLPAALFSAALFAIALAGTPDAHAANEKMADFTLRDLNNQEVSLSDFEGKVVLVSFWATWCQPCLVEMKELQKMHVALESKGFTVLSISTDDARSSSMVKPIIKRNKFTFPVLLDKQTTVVSKLNPQKTLPYSVIVDRQGRIASTHMGYTPGDEVALRKEVEALLGGSELSGGE